MNERETPAKPGHHESTWPAYSFLAAAAAEARERSRNYWHKGGDADLAAPRNTNPGWYGKKKPKPDEAAP